MADKIKKEDIVQELITLRVKHSMSVHNMMEYVKKTYGFEQSYSYELVRDARKKIAETYKEWNVNALEEAISDLEEQKENALKEDDKKLALDITKEINKIKGLYVEKIETTQRIIKVKVPGKKNEGE